MTRAELFEGTGVKRYALRYRRYHWEPWEYPADMQFDTVEKAQAALNMIPVSGGYQIAEGYPCLMYGPVGQGVGSKLLDNVLTACGAKRYKLQRWNRHGWMYCNDLQFDTVEEAQAAINAATDGKYRILEAALNMRYEPVEV